VIAVLVLCVVACFVGPLALARGPRRPSLESAESAAVAALLSGRLPTADYHQKMAALAVRADESDPDSALTL
jgi:hypothetical protein